VVGAPLPPGIVQQECDRVAHKGQRDQSQVERGSTGDDIICITGDDCPGSINRGSV
jgi:hypothetical protein